MVGACSPNVADLGLDLRGRIRIGAEIDRILSRGRTQRARTIPVAHVGGTLGNPTVSITREVVVEFASAYLLGFGVDVLSEVLRSPGRVNPLIGRGRTNNATP